MLTKLDIMDPGTNAKEVLDGTSVKLKHGWIGVVNRGQADINSRVRCGGLLTSCLAEGCQSSLGEPLPMGSCSAQQRQLWAVPSLSHGRASTGCRRRVCCAGAHEGGA